MIHEEQHANIAHTEHGHDAYGDKMLFLPGLSVIFFAFGMYNLVQQKIIIGFISTALFFVAVMIYFYYRATKPALHDTLPYANLQMWGFLASEVIFFTAIIGVSQLIKLIQIVEGHQWFEPGQILDVNLTAINTFILICSSLTMVMAQDAVKQGKLRDMKLYLIATFLIGATFLSIQVFEYNNLMTETLPANLQTVVGTETIKSFTPSHSLYAATFFLQTGFHGFHVMIGLTALIGVIAMSLKGKFTKENHTGLELMGLYWHFIDLVWIVLFAVVYLI